MNIVWKGSPNYWAGRTQKVSKVLAHWSVGNQASTDAQFANANNEVSAHFSVEDDNKHQYVRVEDTAWHARQANPFSVGIELSAGPGRPASDKTYTSAIEIIAPIIKRYRLNPDTDIEYHKKYVKTACSELDLDRIKEGVKKILAGTTGTIPVAPDKPSLPQPAANKGTTGFLSLPSAATSWRVYNASGPYTAGSEVGRLNPSLFGGLTYQILGNPTANVYLIQTQNFGKVAIYAGSETGATVAIGTTTTVQGSGGGKTVYLPAVPTWRVYRAAGPWSIGNEIGYLAPTKFGGLSYAILSQPSTNVAVIQTQSFGKVAIYTGSDSGASIR